MAQIIATVAQENSHYYTLAGEPVHGTLREARKAQALPSVTNILGVLAKPGLDAWKQETAILQSLTLPRLDGEQDPDFAKRVVASSKTELQAAADRGTYVHALFEKAIRERQKQLEGRP